MKGLTASLVAAAISLVVVSRAPAERVTTRVTPKQLGNHQWTFKVDAAKRTEKEDGECIDFRVTASMTDANTHPLPRRVGWLTVRDGKEFISSCEVRSTSNGREMTFDFRIAAKHAASSRFMFGETAEEGRSDGFYYLFDLGDFMEKK